MEVYRIWSVAVDIMNLLQLATPKYASFPFAIVFSNKTIKVILMMDVQTWPRRNDSGL